ncbi:hypothetical protein GS424_008605 [Eggerthella guodeyinii]|uniref:Uncharacterized protein n=1 Tax=Eggerthella guodeyinii TaxID=2690837 RepID=A0A6L7IPL8_9ACTN|nr:DUF5996 family protein [Eggerthella guodeyinii]QOS69880.1 hypothetical protein GS424_008605 [Eggerthella guodeyinii]
MSVLTYQDWRDTCNTEHMLLQMMGKVKLESMDPQPEWKQVVLDADADGFTTGLIPAGADGFEIRLSIADAEMRAETTAGDRARFPIRGRASVSELYSRFNAMLENVGHPVAINPIPQEMYTDVPFDRQDSAHEFDEKAAQRSFRQFLFARGALSGFAAPFRGKKIPPSLFWGTFDLTTVLFSGKPCPFERTASLVERVAFDEQFVECGFWPGDDAVNDPSFFVLAYPFLEEGSSDDADVQEAFYDAQNAEYFLRLEDVLRYDDPEAAVRRFCSSAFDSIMRRQGWERRDWFTEPLLNA